MSESEQAEAKYREFMLQLGNCAGCRPNDMQADPWNVPYYGGPAGYTLRDMITAAPTTSRY